MKEEEKHEQESRDMHRNRDISVNLVSEIKKQSFDLVIEKHYKNRVKNQEEENINKVKNLVSEIKNKGIENNLA